MPQDATPDPGCDWSTEAARALRQLNRHQPATDAPLPARILRLAYAARALRAPRAGLRRLLCATLPPDQGRRGLRLAGQLAPVQGILNAGALLHWTVQDRDGEIRAAAFEKLFRRPHPRPHRARARDWMTEARALAGLHPLTDSPGCTLPPLLAVRRHGAAIGVVTGDLRQQGWRAVELDQAVDEAPAIAAALAALACDYTARPPFACRHLTLPVARPFFTLLNDTKFERLHQALRNSGIGRVRAARCIKALRALDRGWDRAIAACGLPWRVAHGDPYFRNILMRDRAVALVDLETAVIGPVGLDIGRFIGTTLMRGAEARAEASQFGHALPSALDRLRRRPALDRLVSDALDAHGHALARGGLAVDPAALSHVARISALMGFCYGSSVILRASTHDPRPTAPLALLIVDWAQTVRAG